MHDPKTVAFDIKSPIKRKTKWSPDGYRETLVTIWHNDPEHGGDDDSCGWSYVNLSKGDREWSETASKKEWKFFFGEEFGSINLLSADNVSIIAAVWAEVRHYVTGKHRCDVLSYWDMAESLNLLTNNGDNFGHLIADAKTSEERFADLLRLTLRCYRTRRRHWWQHPKWHVHHWNFQIHPLQKLKRWVFSRCAKCGKGFRWGYSPCASGWHSKKRLWFQGEKDVFHHECMNMRAVKPESSDDSHGCPNTPEEFRQSQPEYKKLKAMNYTPQQIDMILRERRIFEQKD